jgi:hypothetical protein
LPSAAGSGTARRVSDGVAVSTVVVPVTADLINLMTFHSNGFGKHYTSVEGQRLL